VRKSGSLLTTLMLLLSGVGGVSVVLPSAAQAASCRQALSVSVSPDPMTGNGASVATVWLRCRLGSHGARVGIKSGWSGFVVPQSVWVPARSNSARFTVRDSCTTSMETHPIGVQLGKLHATTTVKAWPCATLTGFAVSPGSVVGGQKPTATVTLSAPAPSGGYDIDVSGGNGQVDMPSLVTVAAGSCRQPSISTPTRPSSTSTSA
jgi:hypothetical protein